jgi:hypothetical protein
VLETHRAVKRACSSWGHDRVDPESRCSQWGRGGEHQVKALTAPQAAYDKALGAREKLVPEHHKAYRKLKKHAAVVWDDEPETFEAVFAPPSEIQVPRRPRKKATQGAKGAKGAASDET